MPRSPITSRTLFYDQLRDGTYRLLDWCVINTSLGLMVEPRNIATVPANGKVVQNIFDDTSFTEIKQMDEDQFYRFYNTGGRLIPAEFL